MRRGTAKLSRAGGLPWQGTISSFLCAEYATIADIACYEELGQLCSAQLFDFASFPKLLRWLDAMRQLPFHEQAHRYNATLGDLATNPNTIERFLEAGSVGLAALEECGAHVDRQWK